MDVTFTEVHPEDEHEEATFLNVHERLAFLVLVPNLAVMIYLLCLPSTFDSPIKLSTPVAAKITMTVLIRNERVINFLFWSLGKTPRASNFDCAASSPN